MTKETLDILIPSYRADEHYLLGMLNADVPDSLRARFIVVLDNPAARISGRLADRLREDDVTVIRNARNLGAPASRNIALDASSADWVLFWDDDIAPDKNTLYEFASLMRSNIDAPGFVAPAMMPPAHNSFTKGIDASDMLTFWRIPDGYEKIAWGVTANLMIRRAAIGRNRFALEFPKQGGGEDIDFCLRITKECGAPFAVARAAAVRHEWWSDGRRSYVRFMRWAYGDSVLPSMFPAHRYYNFPNMAEFILVGETLCGALWLAGGSGLACTVLAAGALLGEICGEWTKQWFCKRNSSFIIAAESSIVRCSNDIGRLFAHVRRLRLLSIMERFDYFCDKRHIRFERKIGAIKFSLFVGAALITHSIII